MARRRRGAGISTLFVVLGLVAVLGGTFAAGFFTGRHWERVRVVTGLVKPQAGKEPERRALAGRPTDSPAVPPLTFYQELTAPLASPPPRPSAKAEAHKAAKAGAPKPKPELPKVEPAPEANVEPKPEPKPEPKAGPVTQAAAEAPNAARPERARGYTVQVAAYGTRAQAESLVQRLATLGFQGDVSETTTPAGVRYRVRVGTYPTKEAARDAAGRLGAATSLGGFVAAR